MKKLMLSLIFGIMLIGIVGIVTAEDHNIDLGDVVNATTCWNDPVDNIGECTIYEGKTIDTVFNNQMQVYNIISISENSVILNISGYPTESLSLGSAGISLTSNNIITIIEIVFNSSADIPSFVRFNITLNNSIDLDICTDTDGGKNYYLFGRNFGAGDGHLRLDYCSFNPPLYSGRLLYGSAVVDECSGENCYLVEYFCPGVTREEAQGKSRSEIYECPNGCSAGACITITDNEKNETENETDDDEERRREGLGRIIRRRVKAGIYTNEDGDEIRVRELAQGRFRFEFKEHHAETELEIEEETENNRTKFKVKLSNGRNAIIKIMPDVASATALARLRLKVCNATRDCSIELKEVGKGNKTRLVYEVRARKLFRIFGFIKNHQEIQTRIDAETGEEFDIKRPWWAWLASESDEADELEE